MIQTEKDFNSKMSKDEIIGYIRRNDNFFEDAHLENYSFHELMLIKISIDAEMNKDKRYKPMERNKKIL